MSVKVKQLPERAPNGVSLMCDSCGGMYSADKGDYFLHSPEYVFTCCDEAMDLVCKTITYEVLKPEELM